MVQRKYDSTGKRAELVRAAKELLHEQGFNKTTLADVALRATVSLGNVYYYFATKQALAEAVIMSHCAQLRKQFELWASTIQDPKLRLRSMVRAPLDSADSLVQYGCPHGSLCQELEKLGADTALAKAGALLLSTYVDWAQEQFQALGFKEKSSHALAEQLVAALQGTILIAHTMRSGELLARQLGRIELWLEEIVERRIRRKS
jgi:TetR/AcrR family transcriptional regulator, transcriptional repressor for nem operon